MSKSLFLSIGTVKNYISRIYRKLNVNNRPELMALLYSFQKSGMKE
ncbi:response regulator transcription factor [Streptomyces sp. ISL-14]|nr:response regulator transcription factor [Streptomyces sp. ISL-14]